MYNIFISHLKGAKCGTGIVPFIAEFNFFFLYMYSFANTCTALFCLQAFNPDTEFQFKNRTKHWDKKYYEGVFGADDCYALCPPSSAYYTSPSYKVLG